MLFRSPCVERLVGATFLYVARVGIHLKLIDLLFVPTVVGVNIVLVVGLAHVEHANILAIDKLMDWLVALAVDVDARRLDDGLQCGVFETATGVVATIANLQLNQT